jgi:hypothetical protein
MKKLTFVILSLIITHTIYAQRQGDGDKKSVFLGAGFELGLPSNSPLSVGYGGSLKLEIPVVQAFAVTLTGGYMSYNYKGSFLNLTDLTTDLHPQFAPLKAGIRYQLGPGFYTEGEMGDAVKLNNGSGGLFDYSIGLGFYAPLSHTSALDIGFRYEAYSENQYRQTGIRIAYRVGW